MRWSTIGRALLGLLGVTLIGYVLSRGVYVGSAIMLDDS